MGMDKKALSSGSVKINAGVYRQFREYAKAHGMTVGALAGAVLAAWLRGEAFFLPKGLRIGKAPVPGDGGKGER